MAIITTPQEFDIYGSSLGTGNASFFASCSSDVKPLNETPMHMCSGLQNTESNREGEKNCNEQAQS